MGVGRVGSVGGASRLGPVLFCGPAMGVFSIVSENGSQ